MSVRRSLLLITVDCLRADHVGFLGYQRSTTAFLDSLAARGISMSNAIVAGAPTYYSFPPMMASRYPLALGRDVIGLFPGETTIASVLKESGYATAAFVAGNPYLSKQFGYAAGFDTFRDFQDSGTGALAESQEKKFQLRSRLNRFLGDASHKLRLVGAAYDEIYFQYCQRMANAPKSFDDLRRFPSADIIVDHARTWLTEAADQPFFLWLHFMDPHSPYYPKQEALTFQSEGMNSFRARYLNSLWNRSHIGTPRLKRHLARVISLYDAGIRWVDTQIERLVDTLRMLRKWDNCVFALTSDHGEEFLDHGGRYHAPSKITEELIRVPLLVHAPTMDKAQRVDSPFSLLDLAPTLLDVMNCPVPASFWGRSHWNQIQQTHPWEEPAVVECVAGCTNPFHLQSRMAPRIIGIREKRYKLVLDFATSTEHMFDLKNDIGELCPLGIDEQKPARKRLLQRAYRHLAESTQSRDPGQRLSAQLRDLQLELAHS